MQIFLAAGRLRKHFAGPCARGKSAKTDFPLPQQWILRVFHNEKQEIPDFHSIRGEIILTLLFSCGGNNV